MPDSSLILYSTNTHLKFRIGRDLLGDQHYVWCSHVFNAGTLGRYAIGAAMPPSSDPCSIYRELDTACRRRDDHATKIAQQKAMLTSLAVELEAKGRITPDVRDEMVAMVSMATFSDWKPLLYVIPFQSTWGARVQSVERARRASNEPEFIIPDLRGEEFHVIEFPDAA
jgi:hypothetical protein